MASSRTVPPGTALMLPPNYALSSKGKGKGKSTSPNIATALHAGMTVEEMTHLDLAYAPPYAPVWDPILVAARKATTAVGEAL